MRTMKEQLIDFECKHNEDKTRCDWCDQQGELWACVIHKNAEGGNSHLHICGDCNGTAFKLTKKAMKRHSWGEL